MLRLLALLLLPFTALAAPTESRESLEWKQGESLPYLQFLPEGYDKDTWSIAGHCRSSGDLG